MPVKPTTPTRDQKVCASGFRRYERKTGPVSSSVLQGQLVDRSDGKTYVRDDDTGRVVVVPPGYRLTPVSHDWLMRVICKPTVDRAKLEAAGAVRWSEWINTSRRHWMTLSDLASLSPGKPVKLVLLHRNVGDLSADESVNARGRAIRPARFFRKCVAVYVPDSDGSGGNTRGTMQFTGEGELEQHPMELDVEYKAGLWHPLKNGRLPARDPQNISGRLLGRGVAAHWKEMPRRTRVGWRGPMMRLEAVKDPSMPSIYYDD